MAETTNNEELIIAETDSNDEIEPIPHRKSKTFFSAYAQFSAVSGPFGESTCQITFYNDAINLSEERLVVIEDNSVSPNVKNVKSEFPEGSAEYIREDIARIAMSARGLRKLYRALGTVINRLDEYSMGGRHG